MTYCTIQGGKSSIVLGIDCVYILKLNLIVFVYLYVKRMRILY